MLERLKGGSRKSLRKGLSRAKLEVEDARLQALYSLAGGRFCEVERQLRVLSVRTRRKEKGRSRCKVINLEKIEESCQKHQICRWVQRFKRQIDERCQEEKPQAPLYPIKDVG